MRPKGKLVSKIRASPRVPRKNRQRTQVASHVSEKLQSQPPGDIPNEILSQILCRCDETTLRTAMRTCRRWHSVINETIGVSVAIGKSYELIPRKSQVPFQPIEVIESVGVKHCYVGDLMDVQGCPFGYPQTVRSMVFDGPITNFNMVTLLSPLPALAHLTMHYSSLENVKLNRCTLNTTSLKSLRITSHGVGEELDRNQAVIILKNIISLLMAINSLQLSVLILDVVNIPSYDRKVTTAIFSALLRHKHSMRSLQFYHFTERLDPGPPGTESKSETTCEKEDTISRAIQEAVHLKRISYGGKRGMESEEAWNQLIQSQQHLQEMFYMNDNRDIYSTCIPCLTRNYATLRKTLFHISGVDETRNSVRFDCRIFKNFKKLSHLLVRGRKVAFPFAEDIQGDVAVGRILIKVPILRNIECAPDTVTVLSMRDICVETENLSKLLDSNILPNLQKFRLVECGDLGDYGINPDTLVGLLKRDTLKEIEIIQSFSVISWDNARGKDIWEDAIFFKIKTVWEFHAERDDAGNLNTKEEPMFNYGGFETTLRADDVCEVVFQ